MSHIILVGAGHVHLGLFARLSRITGLGHQVTVISRSPTYCYSGMAPGMLGGQYEGSEISLDIQSIVEKTGVRFLAQNVVCVDPSSRILTLENGTTEHYDLVSFNIGSHIPLTGLRLASDITMPAKPIRNFMDIKNRAEAYFSSGRRLQVVVAGGGPAGLEISANLAQLARERQGEIELTLVSAGPLMSMLPERARRKTTRTLKDAGVQILEDCRLISAENQVALVETAAGSRITGAGSAGGAPAVNRDAESKSKTIKIPADLVIMAIGVEPERLFQDSGLPVASDGALLVNKYLQCPEHPEIFGGGDCVAPLSGRFPRIGVVACRQNPVITRNLLAALKKKPLKQFRPRRKYLQIFNLGNHTGLVAWGRLWFKGSLAFILKDAIDRRFIRRLSRSLGL